MASIFYMWNLNHGYFKMGLVRRLKIAISSPAIYQFFKLLHAGFLSFIFGSRCYNLLPHRCGPCRRIAPVFAEFSIQYPAAVFLKVDVDQCQVNNDGYIKIIYFIPLEIEKNT